MKAVAMMVALMSLVAIADDGGVLALACQKGEVDGGVLAPLVAETLGMLDRQRVDYARMLLTERGVSPDSCRPLLEAVRPEWVVGAEAHGVLVEWASIEGDEGVCFRIARLTVKGTKPQQIQLPGESFCLDPVEPLISFEDFDFDGRLDVRLKGRLGSQSRRADQIILQKRPGVFERSQSLSSLDDVEIDAAHKSLTSRVLREDKTSFRQRWRWRKGVLEAVP